MRKKITYLLFCFLTLAACVTPSRQVSTTDLLHHNFVLTQYDNRPIKTKGMQLRLEFGEKMFVSGSMCHTFSGFGSLKDDVLKVEKISVGENSQIQARKNKDGALVSCDDPLFYELDDTIKNMLTDGVQIQLDKNILTLKSKSHTLVYVLKDWVY